MKDKFILWKVLDGVVSPRQQAILEHLTNEYHPIEIDFSEKTNLAEDMVNFRQCKILFVISLEEDGINMSFYHLLKYLRNHPQMLMECTGAVWVDGQGDLFTKSIARELVFAANQCGCAFIGRPLVEGIGSLKNFAVQAQVAEVSLLQAYRNAMDDLVSRLLEAEKTERRSMPKLVVFHASSHKTSNTLALWGKIKSRLSGFQITELSLRNGTVEDCAGCPYEACLHFGERGQCFYGGTMQEEVYPAVLAADAIIMLCPNYNDALSASLTAFINRLTALFRVRRFYDKKLYAIVVSGYSGGEILAKQLISALNMNKSFYLPANFTMLETANAPGEAEALQGIDERCEAFAKKIINEVAQR